MTIQDTYQDAYQHTYDDTYAPDRASARNEQARPGFAARLGRRLNVALKRLQYARMMQALDTLSNAQLAEMGLEREDIAARARRLIDGSD